MYIFKLNLMTLQGQYLCFIEELRCKMVKEPVRVTQNEELKVRSVWLQSFLSSSCWH